MRRIIVCGGRDFNNRDVVFNALGNYGAMFGPFEIVHGGAGGADSLAGEFGKQHGLTVHVEPANWREHGKAAGPIRNKLMLAKYAPICHVLAFPGGRGTAHMVKIAREAGVAVLTEFPRP